MEEELPLTSDEDPYILMLFLILSMGKGLFSSLNSLTEKQDHIQHGKPRMIETTVDKSITDVHHLKGHLANTY